MEKVYLEKIFESHSFHSRHDQLSQEGQSGIQRTA